MSDQLRNLEQKRAEYALECVKRVPKEKRKYEDIKAQLEQIIKNKRNNKQNTKDEEDQLNKVNSIIKQYERYKSLARSSGPLILKSGLIQALIFYLSKGDVIFVKDILKHCDLPIDDNADNAATIAQKLTELNQEDVMRITQEALRIIDWLKRFAEIVLGD